MGAHVALRAPRRQDTIASLALLARFRTWCVALVVVAIAWWVLHRTQLGRTVYAIGGSEQSALLMGLHVARTKVLVYVISGTCAGIGGLQFAMFSRSGYALTGVAMELDAIAAVVIGGTLLSGGRGTIVGTVFGVLIFMTLTNVFVLNNLSISAQAFTKGLIIIVAVLLQKRFSRQPGS
jgi:ribose transport system permease protein